MAHREVTMIEITEVLPMIEVSEDAVELRVVIETRLPAVSQL